MLQAKKDGVLKKNKGNRGTKKNKKRKQKQKGHETGKDIDNGFFLFFFPLFFSSFSLPPNFLTILLAVCYDFVFFFLFFFSPSRRQAFSALDGVPYNFTHLPIPSFANSRENLFFFF